MNNYLKLGLEYGTKKFSGRPRKLTQRQERLVIRELSAGGTSLGRLAQDPNIYVHKSMLSRMMSTCKCKYIEIKKAASTNQRTQNATGSLGKTTHDLESRMEASIV